MEAQIYETLVPLAVRDLALQLAKWQLVKTADSPETIVSPADDDDSASKKLKKFEFHEYGWTTKDTPPP
jgi:hypothetical protein